MLHRQTQSGQGTRRVRPLLVTSFDAGIHLTDIALWLGHESTESTQSYLHADLGMKERALDRLMSPGGPVARRYKPNDEMLDFLEAL